jgi:hypothetical protein
MKDNREDDTKKTMAKAITAWGIRGHPLTRFCILSDKMRILLIYLQGKYMGATKT